MLFADLIDIPFEVFGGFCPAIPPADLSSGAAAIAQDVIFPQGAVRTRGGLKNFFSLGSPIPANASINGLKSYITPTLAQRLLAWDSLGNFYKESPQGTLNSLFSRPYTGLFYQSNTQFGREYQAFFNSLGGFDIPRQYDDTNWDRVSQVGPGASPFCTDLVASLTILASPNGLLPAVAVNIQSITMVGVVATVTTAGTPFQSPLGTKIVVKPGDSIQIAGVATTGYNANWILTNVISANQAQFVIPTGPLANSGVSGTLVTGLVTVVTNTTSQWFGGTPPGQLVTIAGATTATFDGTFSLLDSIVQIGPSTVSWIVNLNAVIFGTPASGGGTLAPTGNVSVGLHQVSCSFITRQGLITSASVPASFTAAGAHALIVTGIPIGPANITSRLIHFTPAITAPAKTGNFFSLPNGSQQIFGATMLVADNTSTAIVVDFSDTVLSAGFSANYLFSQIELGESAFTVGYNARGVWLGERNKLQNLVNLTFDGGFSGNVPLGWTLDATSGAGGSSAVAGGFSADWGDAYAITGDGATAVRGKITQSAFKDYLGVAIIGSALSYSVRVRLAKNNTLAQGTVHVSLTGTGVVGTGISVTAAQLTANYQEFTAVLTAQIAAPLSDLTLNVFADGTPTNNGVFLVDSIELYPTNTPFNYSTGRLSHAFNPESFDATTGQVQIRTNDGQQLRAAFPIRNNIYFAKDHYLCYVQDDGLNEPSSWAVNEVSATIGICGPNAVDTTEEWAVFAERSGLYICWGSDPVKLTPEIQTDASGTGKISWASINWSAGHTIWVRIDRTNKMILVGAPVGKNPDGGLISTPNVVFMMDYKWLDGAQDIANSPLITYSSFTGKILSHGRGRRWALWTITSNSMTFAERSDGTAQPFFGNGAGNGKIYQQIDCATQGSDDGVAIPWNYQGYGCPAMMEEQMFQLGAHLKRAGYMKWRAVGSGLLPLAIVTARRTTVLRPYTLSLAPVGDGGIGLNIRSERFFVNIGTNAVAGSWFQLERLVLCLKKDSAIVVSGLAQ
jgi:hypothetical protein